MGQIQEAMTWVWRFLRMGIYHLPSPHHDHHALSLCTTPRSCSNVPTELHPCEVAVLNLNIRHGPIASIYSWITPKAQSWHHQFCLKVSKFNNHSACGMCKKTLEFAAPKPGPGHFAGISSSTPHVWCVTVYLDLFNQFKTSHHRLAILYMFNCFSEQLPQTSANSVGKRWRIFWQTSFQLSFPLETSWFRWPGALPRFHAHPWRMCGGGDRGPLRRIISMNAVSGHENFIHFHQKMWIFVGIERRGQDTKKKITTSKSVAVEA